MDQKNKEDQAKRRVRPEFLLDQGRVPPQAVDLEEAVLGATMLEKEALIDVLEILKPDAFYKEAHRVIWTAITELFRRGDPIDILSVINQLKHTAELDLVGGAYYITQLTNRVASSANVEYHSRIIAEKFIQRELIRVSTEIIKDAYEDTTDVFDLLDKANSSILSVTKQIERSKSQALQDVAVDALKKIKMIKADDAGGWGIKTEISILDNLTRGFQAPDFIVIAGRPGMGKTALMVTMAKNIGINNKVPIAVFSLEMSSEQLMRRIFSQHTGISYGKLSGGRFDEAAEISMEAYQKEIPRTFIIDDTGGLSIMELRAKCIRMKMEHKVKIIMIDYLQLMSGNKDKRQSREQEISEISRGIKALSKELDIPIVALSQLSRSVETRGGDHRPKLSDLRESGAIEQDADMVMFCYRASYYFKAEQMEDKGIPEDEAELIVEKHRNGRLGAIKTRWIQESMMFKDYIEESEIEIGTTKMNFGETPF